MVLIGMANQKGSFYSVTRGFVKFIFSNKINYDSYPVN